MSQSFETETRERAAPSRSPLEETHARLGASMTERDGWAVPAHYGDARAEYEHVRGPGGAGLFDLSSRGRIEVGGGEAVQFLNGLITNDVKTLEDGAWMHAAFPNVQGRLVGQARVVRRGDVFLFDTEPPTHAPVLKSLERFTLAGDFRVKDLTAETALISLQGARANEIIKAALGETTTIPERGRAVVAPEAQGAQPLIVIRATHTAEDGFDLIVGATDAPSLWQSLTDAGARSAGFDALEVLRVEAGVARYGVDVDETNVVLEAVPDDAVSFTKGCYVGQEIIARIHWRGHVAKRLAGLVLESETVVRPGAVIRPAGEEREVGRVTSCVFSPRMGKAIGLGVVKYDYLKAGTEVRVDSDGGTVGAHVAGLPLVRGSWYETPTGGAEDDA